MAKSLSAYKGYRAIYEKTNDNIFIVFIYEYGKPYKLLDKIEVDSEHNVSYRFRLEIDNFYEDLTEEFYILPPVEECPPTKRPSVPQAIKDLVSDAE